MQGSLQRSDARQRPEESRDHDEWKAKTVQTAHLDSNKAKLDNEPRTDGRASGTKSREGEAEGSRFRDSTTIRCKLKLGLIKDNRGYLLR
jgi:hypothetical protein